VIDELQKLEELAELSLHENPICVHKNLKDQLKEMLPQIEVINQDNIREIGSKYKD